jgi:lipopolysaccharide biosynthesis glycosyltransferase
MTAAAMRNDPIHVSLAVNQDFELPLTVALTSLALAHRPGECQVSVVHNGFTSKARERIGQGVNGHLDIEWIPIDERILSGAHAPASLTKASLYRLLLPQILRERDRTIYLDADLVVLESLRCLWDVDLGAHVLGAVRDAASPWAAGTHGTNWHEVGIAPDSPYFNSGVLLLPLELWRREQLTESALAVLRRVRTRWGDQCAINLVAEGRWLELPRRWNLQTADVDRRGLGWALWRESVEDALAHPAILHFNERSKPWTLGATHPQAETWFQFLDHTALAGWRPRPGKTIAERAEQWVRRVRASARSVPDLTPAQWNPAVGDFRRER